MKKPLTRPTKKDGFILLAVLSLMALLSGLCVVMLTSSRNSLDGAAITSDALNIDAMVQSGLSIAGYQLFALKTDPEAVTGQIIKLDQGSITIKVETETGKADLNASSKSLLAAAYMASGLRTLAPSAFAARVVDWRDADNQVTDDGAEAAEYTAIGLAYTPANRAFRSLGDLRWIPGVSAADILALKAFVTVNNPRGRLDVFSASPALIAALPGVATDTVADVISVRKFRSAASTAKLADLLLVQSALIDGELPTTYRVTLSIQLNGASHARPFEAIMTSGVTPGAAFQVLHWADGVSA